MPLKQNQFNRKFCKKIKSLKSSSYAELEKILIEWLQQAHPANIRINGTMLREKAMEISLKLDITGFSASNGWIDEFKKRHKVAYSSVCDETTSVDQAMTGKGMHYHL